jgi:hypothetical protein
MVGQISFDSIYIKVLRQGKFIELEKNRGHIYYGYGVLVWNDKKEM